MGDVSRAWQSLRTEDAVPKDVLRTPEQSRTSADSGRGPVETAIFFTRTRPPPLQAMH